MLGQPLNNVTPLVGVWIEIFRSGDILTYVMSLPSWECGLKFVAVLGGFYLDISHSPRGSVD